MNTAIIVSAGSGSRFGGETPKQFQDLNGKPVIFHTIARFQACNSINKIILVVSEDRIKSLLPACEEFSKLESVVVGGATRAESVLNGLRMAEPKGIVAIHDGARPLVSVDEIARTVGAAETSGAACLVLDVTDTIKQIENGKITGTLDRSKLKRAVTPQCFEYDLILRAFEEADMIENATDECSLVEALGVEITAVEGTAQNIKITVAEDLQIASVLEKYKNQL
jgi:2-C-methyl-D-erythritol 4-phosphate cytidylyltransferase